MVLFINACVRKESRTKRLADHLLSFIDDPVETVDLSCVEFPRTNAAFLKERDRLIASEAFDHPSFALARQFASADVIVIAAPYWDLSFPAVLKQYFELINVIGVTFCYTKSGVPKGLCRAQKLYYVSTAGGNYVPEEYGFGYVKALARNFYGIDGLIKFGANGLDIVGADVNAILSECEKQIEDHFAQR